MRPVGGCDGVLRRALPLPLCTECAAITGVQPPVWRADRTDCLYFTLVLEASVAPVKFRNAESPPRRKITPPLQTGIHSPHKLAFVLKTASCGRVGRLVLARSRFRALDRDEHDRRTVADSRKSAPPGGEEPRRRGLPGRVGPPQPALPAHRVVRQRPIAVAAGSG